MLTARPTIYDKLVWDLRDAIRSEQLASGDRIPSEHELAEQYGMSRPSVRKALAILETEGLLYKQPGRGAFVRERSTRARRPCMIGINTHAIPSAVAAQDPHVAGLLQGMVAGCAGAGHRFVLVDDSIFQDNADGLDGMLWLYATPGDSQRLGDLSRPDCPVVLVNRTSSHPALSHIGIDNVCSAASGVEHVWLLGHRRFAFVHGTKRSSAFVERAEGARQALAEHGLAPEATDEIFVETPLDAGTERQRLHAFLRDTTATAIFTTVGFLALPCLLALRDLGRRVPEDVSFLTHDDMEPLLAPLGWRITCVRQPLETIGRRAVETVLESRAQRQTGQVREILPTELVVRDSCCPPETGETSS